MDNIGGKICIILLQRRYYTRIVLTIVERPVDLLMGHDGTAVLAIDKFNEDRKDIRTSYYSFDHFSPPSSVERQHSE